MHPNRGSKKMHRARDQSISPESQSQGLKNMIFSTAAVYLEQSETMSPMIFYLMTVIECLSFLWFVIHPSLHIYSSDTFLLKELSLVLKGINFYEFLSQNANLMIMTISIIYGCTAIQTAISLISIYQIVKNKTSSITKYFRKMANFLFILTVKALCGPFVGGAVTVLACGEGSPYHQTQACYQGEHFLLTALAAFLVISLVWQILFYSLFYFIKNPFSSSVLGTPSQTHMLSKGALKLLFPLYFAIRFMVNLDFIYILLVPVLWGTYIFYHRLFGAFSYNHQHFYFQFFLQGFLFWMSVCSLLSVFIYQGSNPDPMALVYSLLSSLAVGVALVNIRKTIHDKFMQKCFEGRLKKQDIEHYLFGLVSATLHVAHQSSAKIFQIYSKLIQHNNKKSRHQLVPNSLTSTIDREDSKLSKQLLLKQRIFAFLLELLNKHLSDSKSVTLKVMRCHLLKCLGYCYYSLHQSYELSSLKLSFSDQFALYQFKRSLGDNKKKYYSDKNELVRMYSYQRQMGKLQGLMEQCAINNAQFWQEIGDNSPSLPKMRNLATRYSEFMNNISQTYQELRSQCPQSLLPVTNYHDFLLQIGADTRTTLQVGQILKALINSKQRISISGDSTCMVVVDTVGSNLGTIVNCNRQIKKLLGFQKQSLYDKNITRIMPKIFSQLHNSLILNFIKRQRTVKSEKQSDQDQELRAGTILPSQKIVMALDSESMLVETGLNLQIITSVSNSLLIAGFLRKVENNGKGILLVDVEKGDVVGLNRNFAALTKDKFTGRLVVQEEVKVTSLLPQIDLNSIKAGCTYDSILQTGQIKAEGADHKDTVVKVEVIQSKDYFGKKLMTLSVSEKRQSNPNQLVCLNHRLSSGSRSSLQLVASGKGFTSLFNPKQNNHSPMRLSQTSQFQTSTTSISHKAELAKDITMARELSQLVLNRQKSQMPLLVISCYLLVIICVGLYFGLIFSYSDLYLKKAEEMYGKMQLMSDIPYFEGEINLYTNRIWCLISYHYLTKDPFQYTPHITQAADRLSSSYTSIMEAIASEPYPLVYNEQKLYNFTITRIVNQTVVLQPKPMTVLEGIQVYISSARSMADPKLISTNAGPNRYMITQQAKYISQNGDSILPSIALLAGEAYSAYFSSICSSSMLKILIIKLSSIAIGLAIFLGTLALKRALVAHQVQVYNAYNKIRLWDINELRNKCHLFLKKRGKPLPKVRSSRMLQIFPVKTIVDFVDQSDFKKKNTKHAEVSSRMRRDEDIEGSDDQALLLKQKNKDYYVQIGYQEIFRGKFLFYLMLGFTIVAVGLMVFTLSRQYQTVQLLQEKIALLRDIGQVRKSLTYLNLFASRIVSSHPDYSYAVKIADEIARFYALSSLTYPQLGEDVFKKVYGNVQLLSAFFAQNPKSRGRALLRDMYPSISAILLQACEKINQMDQTIFAPAFYELTSESRAQQTVLIVGLVLIAGALMFIVHCVFIGPLNYQRTQVVNLIKILPVWVIHRNPLAFSLLYRQ